MKDNEEEAYFSGLFQKNLRQPLVSTWLQAFEHLDGIAEKEKLRAVENLMRGWLRSGQLRFRQAWLNPADVIGCVAAKMSISSAGYFGKLRRNKFIEKRIVEDCGLARSREIVAAWTNAGVILMYMGMPAQKQTLFKAILKGGQARLELSGRPTGLPAQA